MRDVVSDTAPDGMQPTASDRSIARRWPWLVGLCVSCVVHAILSVRLFPSFGAMLSDEPVISVDHAIHLYHGSLGAQFLKEHGTSWGYDPYFMAGYPKTPVYDSSSAPAELFQLVAGGYSPRAYKIGVVLLVALVPVVLAAAARSFGADWPAVVGTSAWMFWYWWTGFPDTLVRTGLVAFVWSSAVAVLAPAIFARWCRRPSAAAWSGLTLAAAIGIQAHSIFPLMVAAPLAAGYLLASVKRPSNPAVGDGSRGGGWHAATWLGLLLALAATHFWWWPLLRFLSLKTGSDLFMQAKFWGFVLTYYVLHDGRVPLLVAGFGTAGLVRWWRAGQRLEVATLAAQIAVLSLLTFAGSMWSVTRDLEPLRFQVPLHLAWCVPAGEGLRALVVALHPRALVRSRSAMIRWVAVALPVIAAVGLTTFPAIWWRRVGLRPDHCPPSTWEHTRVLGYARPLAVGLRPEMTELVQWLTANTDSSARILLEDQLRLLENRDASAPESLHWTPLLPMLTDREFVGGLYHLAFIPHQYAAFGDWKLAGKHIREWSPERLEAFCELYNIGWVVTWSRASPLKGDDDRNMPLATEEFGRLPSCERVATLPRYTNRPDENEYAVFRVRREPSYFARGRGRVVQADFNSIELADLEPDAGELVLRYHWQAGFRADPPATLERADVADDPIGFIRIRLDSPAPRLVLSNAYR